MTVLRLNRRAVLASAGSVLGFGSLAQLSTSTSPPVEGSWSFGRGDPQNTAYTTDSGPTKSVTVSWRYNKHLSSMKAPVIADGTVYLGFHDETVEFVALDAATGEEQWRTKLGDESDVGVPDAAAAIVGDVVLAPFGNRLIAFDRRNGDIRWERQFDEEVNAPTVVDGVAYFVIRGDGVLIALDSETGDTTLEQSVGEWAKGAVAVSEDRVFAVATTDNETSAVVALDTRTGERLWQYTNPHPITGTPAVAKETVYVSDARGVHAIASDDGSRRWRFEGHPIKEREWSNFSVDGSAPAVANGTVYTGAADERVYALDADSGEKRWEFWTWNNVTGDPVVTDETVYIGSEDSYIYALDVETGTRHWEFDTAGRIRGTGGAVVDGRLYISTFSDGLYVLEEA
ncbi:outer membrane protein assembly factor BamB family protein [Halocatena marina]|uniref:outer membrane protein assembly factor BamB family protein n=1 Tax=Halocatena marina TaxID=2934937 RepID=UPI00200CB88B|nr:PQQ-binding-like beta-propeller repeat protein [Halocatena marina]